MVSSHGTYRWLLVMVLIISHGIQCGLLQYQKGLHADGEVDEFDRLEPLPRSGVK